MKFKFYYIIIFYEIVTFIHEMYKRNAKSIRFELQESVGKVNIYIDDSSFKQIDGSIAWKIVKSMFAYISKKEHKSEEFDKDKDVSGTLDQSDFDKLNKKFKFNILPLPKGKSISYSYIKKSGNIYEAAFTLVSNDLDSYILEQVKDLQELINSNVPVFFIDDEAGKIEVETLAVKKEKLKILCEDLKGNSILKTVNIKDAFSNKKDVNKYFAKFMSEKDIQKQTEEKVTHEETEDKPKDLEKISW